MQVKKFTAVLDANTLYPAPLRDYLLQLASLGLYRPKWTEEIQNEWIRNLLIKRNDLTAGKLEKAIIAMNSAFPDSNVTGYEAIITRLSLNDSDDKHALAAAIRADADVIVTFNLKDFPLDYLKEFGMEPQHPDEFISNLINLNKSKAIEAFNNQVKSLKNPSQSKEEVLKTLEKCGLVQSAVLLRFYMAQ